MKTIIFAGGGTGGHIYPGLAVINELQNRNVSRIVWIGSSRGMDKSIVESAGIPFKGIPCGKLRRYFSFQNCIDVFKIIGGFVAAFCILKKEKPAVLFSKGGFVSVPPCLAARLLHIPVITHECDFTPGLATRLNAKSASRILVSYEKTRMSFAPVYRSRITVTGNPVRAAFYTADAVAGRNFLHLPLDGVQKPVLAVIGGSLGARQINTIIHEILPKLTQYFTVVHQTGRGNGADSDVLQRQFAGSYLPYEYINKEMPDVLAAADVVVSRAGANSLWECSVLGKPLVLIPLELTGSRGDQLENAEYFAQNGGAKVITGGDVTAENVLCVLKELAADACKRHSLGENARNLVIGKPAAAIADIIQEYV